MTGPNPFPEISRICRVVRKNWDELGVAAALGHLAATGSGADLDPEHTYVVEALRRSRVDLHDADLDEIRRYVASLSEDQIPGLINNLKGIAHEVYFVEAENADGDPVRAYLFEATNHPDFDVVLYNPSSGDSIDLQLKASDSVSYVHEATEELGDHRVVVTSELAERLGLQSSGISNQELTIEVEEVIDRLDADESLWDYVPGLTAWSIALIVASLARRYARGEISRERFLRMVTLFAGAKAVKMALIVAALMVPGLNVAVGAWLFLRLATSVREAYTVKAGT